MDKRTNTIVQMYYECSACMNRNAASYSGYQPLQQAVTTLESRIAIINQTIINREQYTKGITFEKKEKKKQMAQYADAMRMKVQAIALSHNDQAAYKNANYTFSIIYRSPVTSAIAFAQNILRLAENTTPEDRIMFHISDRDIDDLRSVINKFNVVSTARRSSVVIKQTTGDVLQDLIRETSNFIRATMSALMGNYKITNTRFYMEWEHAKRIINSAQHHAQITGEVYDAVTQQPLQLVKVIATDGIRTFEDMTDGQGIYKIPVNPEIWSLTFELPSYQKQQLPNILVDSGEKQKVNISLSKSPSS